MHLSPGLSSRVSFTKPVLANFLYLMQHDLILFDIDIVVPIVIILQHFEKQAVTTSPVKQPACH